MTGPAAGSDSGESVERLGVEERLERTRSLLAERGIRHELRAVGPGSDIVVVKGPLSLRPRLADLAAEVRAFGFRFVTLELDPTDPGET